MSTIRVLHMLTSNIFSGAENVVCQIANLLKDNENIEIFYSSPDGPIREALREREVNFIPVKTSSIKEYRTIIDNLKPALIHAHDMKASVIASLITNKIPIISHVHNNNYNSRKISLKSILYYFAAKKAKHIFWVSKTSFDGYVYSKYFKDKSEVLYNIIDTEKVVESANKDTRTYKYDFVFIGRLMPQKNPQRLIRIMEMAAQREPDIKFAILGDGPLRNEVTTLMTEKNITKNIDYLGFTPNPYKILKDSKALLLTSRWEGYPMVVLEAFALGVPVISTPVDGLMELVTQNADGFLSDKDDELVDEIIKIYRSRERRDKMSQNAKRKIAEIMDQDTFKEKIIETYKQCSK